MSGDRVVARAVDSAFRCDVCGERSTSKRALDEHATAHPVTADAQRDFHPVGSRPCCAFPIADVQRELAEALRDLDPIQPPDELADYYAEAAALLPTVQALIADAEKRAAAAALESAAREDSVSTHRFTPVEMLTLRVVRVDALLARAAALDPSGAAEGAGR